MVTMKKKKSFARQNNEEEKIKTEFAKIIHPSAAEDYENKLMLPPEFVSKFGSRLSDFATLRVGNGDSLQVRLTTLGRDIWFDNGWKEFVGRYAIHEGFFLLFQYNGCSRFTVLIFDETATEIKYPCDGDVQRNLVKDDEEDCIPEKRKTRTKFKSMTSVHGGLPDGFGSASLGDSKAISEARNYQPENPYFQVLVRACDIKSGFVLHVPAEFSDKYLDTACEYMKILAPSGRKWLVALIWNRKGGVEFRKGWHQFCRENELREGDVCVIEFVKEEMEFKASIFRAASDAVL